MKKSKTKGIVTIIVAKKNTLRISLMYTFLHSKFN